MGKDFWTSEESGWFCFSVVFLHWNVNNILNEGKTRKGTYWELKLLMMLIVCAGMIKYYWNYRLFRAVNWIEKRCLYLQLFLDYNNQYVVE